MTGLYFEVYCGHSYTSGCTTDSSKLRGILQTVPTWRCTMDSLYLGVHHRHSLYLGGAPQTVLYTEVYYGQSIPGNAPQTVLYTEVYYEQSISWGCTTDSSIHRGVLWTLYTWGCTTDSFIHRGILWTVYTWGCTTDSSIHRFVL